MYVVEPFMKTKVDSPLESFSNYIILNGYIQCKNQDLNLPLPGVCVWKFRLEEKCICWGWKVCVKGCDISKFNREYFSVSTVRGYEAQGQNHCLSSCKNSSLCLTVFALRTRSQKTINDYKRMYYLFLGFIL